MTKQPVIQFEQRVKASRPEGDYKVPKTHDPAEIAWRQRYPGAAGARRQSIGIHMGDIMLGAVAESGNEEDLRATAHILAVTALNTGNYGLNSEAVMRRNSRMLLLVDPETDERMSTEEVLEACHADFATAKGQAEGIVTDRIARRFVKKHELDLGRTMIRLATKLVVIDSSVNHIAGNANEVQLALRQACHDTQREAETAWERLGVSPSFAQLADQFSSPAVDIRNNQSTPVFGAYNLALATTANMSAQDRIDPAD